MTLTDAPDRGAPSVLVTLPVICPVACDHATLAGIASIMITRRPVIRRPVLLIEALRDWNVMEKDVHPRTSPLEDAPAELHAPAMGASRQARLPSHRADPLSLNSLRVPQRMSLD